MTTRPEIRTRFNTFIEAGTALSLEMNEYEKNTPYMDDISTAVKLSAITSPRTFGPEICTLYFKGIPAVDVIAMLEASLDRLKKQYSVTETAEELQEA